MFEMATDTKKVIKQYSSVGVACSAAMYISNVVGHQAEMDITKSLVKSVVPKSRLDPSILLFGYRWLTMDCLRDGDFIVNAQNHEAPSVIKEELNKRGLETPDNVKNPDASKMCNKVYLMNN